MRSDRSFGTECEYFTHDGLAGVRQIVERAAHRVGFAAPQIVDLLAAVDTASADAVRAGSEVSVTVVQSPEGIRVEVGDGGRRTTVRRFMPVGPTAG